MNWKLITIWALALTWLLILAGESLAGGPYQPWDTVGIETGADINVPIRLNDTDTTYRIQDRDGSRWGWVRGESNGAFSGWDSKRGWFDGYVERNDAR